MKYVKMLGLAAIAAMALMAFLGAGSASATVLCTTELTSGCGAAGWDYPANTTVHITQKAGTSAILESGSTVLDTCTTSTLHGHSENTGGTNETVKVEVTSITWGTAGTPCTKTTDTLNPGTLEIHWISGSDDGTVTAKGAEVTVNTIFGTCVYGSGASIDLGTLKGGTAPTISIDATVPKISGNALCPGNATWTAEYEVTEPHAVYVATS